MERGLEDGVNRISDVLERIASALEKGCDTSDRLAKLLAVSNRLKLHALSQGTPIFYPIYQSFADALDALEQ